MATITLHGHAANTSGDLPAPGSIAPDFVLVDGDLNDVSLGDFRGKNKLLNIVPSLDTPVCAASTKKFNEVSADYPDTVFLTISADLPFAMKRFCSVEGVDNVIPLAMMRSNKFATDYGVLIVDGPMCGITARALLVLDNENRVIHAELVRELGDQPDYDAALIKL